MKPSDASINAWARIQRREFLRAATMGLGALGASGLAGCKGFSVRRQSPDEDDKDGSGARLVGDLVGPYGLFPVKVESIGLVTGLAGTGSNPPPSGERSMLLDEMQKRGVNSPNQVLASTSTELVIVRGYMRPGIQKGDHFDVEIRVPSRSEATSLRGGWLMETRLKELAITNGRMGENRIREGKPLALCQGAILVDPTAEGEAERIKLTRGRVLGGAVCLESRRLGLILKPKNRNVLASSMVGTAVNHRFHTFVAGIQEGVAKPKDDEYVELSVHPRYKDNIERFIKVVLSIPIREEASKKTARLQTLERQLLDPVTSRDSALRLEALGKDGVPILLKGLAASESEVRFHCAEALAYLDVTEAAEPLGIAARDEPAFRAFAMAALSAMDDYAANEALMKLLDVASAETRYGAFRSLWAMNTQDALVRGENLGDQFSFHVLDVAGPPMVHLTRSYRPEVVLFGVDQRLTPPFALTAGKTIQVICEQPDEVTVSRFLVGEADQKRVISTRLDEIIRTIVDLGGTYPDVVQALVQAKSRGALANRLEMDALPAAGRSYERDAKEADPKADKDESDPAVVGGPSKGGKSDAGTAAALDGTASAPLLDKKAPAQRSWFGRITGLRAKQT